MRKVCYISGTRADYGLMENTLKTINNDVELELQVIITGMHLLQKYGNTGHAIEDSGLPVIAKVPVALSGKSSGAEMSVALGQQVIAFTNIFQKNHPDVVLLLGDRGEMLAGAIAAMHLNIPIAHIHGGERSGTIDESIRHAISKLAHYHFTATQNAKDRLIKMGEKPEHILVTGAPGLDIIIETPLLPRKQLLSDFKIGSKEPFILVLFHPVVQQAEEANQQIISLLDAVVEMNMQVLIIMPNADAGSHSISKAIREYEQNYDFFQCAVHIEREKFLSLVAYAQVLVGNSSSGIIEAASLSTPVVNVGERQNGRERNMNIIDCDCKVGNILDGIKQAQRMKGEGWENIYGDGQTSKMVTKLLVELSLKPDILDKENAY